ncbi:hypothetical protein BDN72DRAFT_438414 [Pluteus cervinus]|uniref:Uncharacterized protein n=1 Tax=Pluteus cervinus TaxID=181527 RepID=A0ACD3A6P8_9AGAR|nr:hypothetical protein BDN72DRAFT_438414 [Pluteus cervinus]
MARLTIRSTKSTSPSPSAPRTFQPHQQRPSGSRYEGTTHTTESTSTDPSSTATPGRPRTSRTTDSSSLFAPTSSSTLAVASTSTSTLTLIKSGGGDSELNHEEVPEIEREAAVNTRLVSILEGDEEEEEGSDEEVQEVPNPALPSRQLRGDTYTAEVVQPAEELDSQLEESTTPASTPSSSSRLAFKKKERTLWYVPPIYAFPFLY